MDEEFREVGRIHPDIRIQLCKEKGETGKKWNPVGWGH